MPITSPLPPSHTTQEEFAQLDYLVMRHAFESQNQLGRLCHELIYQNDLAARLRAAGLPVQTEVPITVTCRDFAKTYSLDLVVADAGIYELKTALGLIGEHEVRGQVSLGKQHFNLLNVETAFRVTALTTGAEESNSQTEHIEDIVRKMGSERW